MNEEKQTLTNTAIYQYTNIKCTLEGESEKPQTKQEIREEKVYIFYGNISDV